MPISTYSAATRPLSNRAAGSRTTTRHDDAARSSSPVGGCGTPGPRPTAHHSATPEAPAITSSTPPGCHQAVRTPLIRGPTKIATDSTQPDPALAAVSSLVVSEISGSRALWTGRVRVMATEPTAARTQTSANDASANNAAPTTAAIPA